jgi:hypothetical protein
MHTLSSLEVVYRQTRFSDDRSQRSASDGPRMIRYGGSATGFWVVPDLMAAFGLAVEYEPGFA